MRILFYSLLIIFFSCRKEIQDKFPDYGPVPTVNCIIVSGNQLSVNISMAGKIDTGRLAWVENASVFMYANHAFVEKLQYQGNGTYQSTSLAQPGTLYKCIIAIPGFDTLVCTTYLPMPEKVFDIKESLFAGKDEEGFYYQSVTFSFITNPGVKTYYQITIKDKRGYDVINKKVVDPVLLNEGLPLLLFSNELIRDSVYTMTVNFRANGSSFEFEQAFLEFRTVSYEYYRYVRQLYLYEQGRYPAFEQGCVQAFPLYSNVQHGLGIFAGYSRARIDTLFKH